MQGPIAALSMSRDIKRGAGGRAWDGRQDPSEGLLRFVKAELPDAVLEETKADGAEGSAQQLPDAVREETKVDGAKGSAQQLHATVLEHMKVDAGEGSAQQLPVQRSRTMVAQHPATELSLAELLRKLVRRV